MPENKPKPIVADLFRFISIRTPQLIDPLKKEVGFIRHPDPDKSKFLSKDSHRSISQSREEMLSVANSFKPIPRYSSVREIKTEVYDFGLWLARNHNKLPAKTLLDKSNGITKLTANQIIELWDNVFYQFIINNNQTVRQAASVMLIANNFLEKTTSSNFETFADSLYADSKIEPSKAQKIERLTKRLAKAKLIIPKSFSVEKKGASSNKKTEKKNYSTNDRSNNYDRLERNALIAALKKRLSIYAIILQDLKTTFRHHPESRNQTGAAFYKTISSQQTVNQHTLNFLKLPGNAKKLAQQLHRELNLVNVNETRLLEQNLKLEENSNSQGALDATDNYCSFITFGSFNGTTHFTITIKMPNISTDVSTSTMTLKKGNETIASSNAIGLIEHNNNYKSYDLFPEAEFFLENNTNFQLNGELSFGSEKTISLDINAKMGDTHVLYCENHITEDDSLAANSASSPVELYGVNRVGMGIFRRVEQEVCCYVPGEVSRIENIMAREYKERHTRNLISSEDIAETEDQYEVENTTDTASTTRNEMQNEVSKVLDKNHNLNLGVSAGVSGKYMGTEISADAYADYAMAFASSTSDREAKTYAEEVTKAAAERILQKTTQKRTSRIIKEFEENNRHGYDNREGDKHVTGVYRWIDIIYTNRLVNYGSRLMVEFLIPEPAKFYKKSLLKEVQETEGSNLPNNTSTPPKHPSEYGVNTPSDIDMYESRDSEERKAYYENLAAAYGISVAIPPNDVAYDDINFAKANMKEGDKYDDSGTMPVPDGFQCTSATITGTYNYDSTNNKGTQWSIDVGNKSWAYNKLGGAANNRRVFNIATESGRNSVPSNVLTFNNYASTTIGVSLHMERTRSYDIKVSFTFEVSPETVLEWQTDVYRDIMDAYEQKLRAYEAAQAQIEIEQEKEVEKLAGSNPAFNRSIEQRELKRVAIEMLTKPFGIQQGASFYIEGQCADEVRQDITWENYSSHVKFFEQAFDWNLMAYLFYPYFWADKCDWKDLLQLRDDTDSIFQSFLQSGMARVVLPVRQGFDAAVNLYFETGKIWNGGDMVLETDDDLYLSIDQEIAEPESFVEEEWETRVPTTLTIIQGDSVFLEDEGLPCCDKLTEDGVDTLLRGSKNLLGLSSGSSES